MAKAAAPAKAAGKAAGKAVVKAAAKVHAMGPAVAVAAAPPVAVAAAPVAAEPVSDAPVAKAVAKSLADAAAVPLAKAPAAAAAMPPADAVAETKKKLDPVSLIGLLILVPSSGKKIGETHVALRCPLLGWNVLLDGTFEDAHGVRDSTSNASWSLWEDEGRAQLLRSGDSVSAISARDAFPERLFEDTRGAFSVKGVTGWRAFDSSCWDPKYGYATFVAGKSVVLKCWQIQHYARGAQYWWSLPDLWAYQPMFKAASGPGRGVNDLLKNVKQSAEWMGLDEHLLIKRNLQGNAHHDSRRCIDVHTVSSTGLALILAMQSSAKQEAKENMKEIADAYRTLFGALLEACCRDREVTLLYIYIYICIYMYVYIDCVAYRLFYVVPRSRCLDELV